jgi:hypothetical protein
VVGREWPRSQGDKNEIAQQGGYLYAPRTLARFNQVEPAASPLVLPHTVGRQGAATNTPRRGDREEKSHSSRVTYLISDAIWGGALGRSTGRRYREGQDRKRRR